MATFDMLKTKKKHLHAHPVDSATPPNPVVAANVPAPGLTWSIVTQANNLGVTVTADADGMGAYVKSVGSLQSGTAQVRWQAPDGAGDTNTINVVADTSAISGGTTTADADEPLP